MELSDDYTQIKFITTGVKAEISGGDLRQAIKILLKNDVLTADGAIDESKIELFIKNYDENRRMDLNSYLLNKQKKKQDESKISEKNKIVTT
jgi:hypothetical protein